MESMVIADQASSAAAKFEVDMQGDSPDSDQFSGFYRSHYSLVLAVVARRTIGLGVAEDITSEVFRVAWQRHQQGVTLSLPWLYTTARNLVGNEHRRQKRHRSLRERAINDLRLQADSSATEDLEDVRLRMAEMQASDRELLQMSYWDELSAIEIAEILGIEPGAVRVRQHRARARLRELLDSAKSNGDQR